MRKNSIFLMSVLAFLLASSAWAAPKTASKNPATMRAAGNIVSVNNAQLVLSSKMAGKAEDTTFILNAQTKKSSPLTAGEHVTVRYRTENGQKVAIRVSANQNAKAGHASKQKIS